MTSLGTILLINRTESKSSLNNVCNGNTNKGEEESRLSLAYEQINAIPPSLLHRFGSVIRTLDISNNKFENVDFLKELPNLVTLICDHNYINSNTEFPFLPELSILWMNHCKIVELYPWIKKLQSSCPNLKYLSLMGNPAAPSYLNGGSFYEYLQYRLFVISLFPTLMHLDDRPVTEEQRQEAYRMFRRPILERLTIGNKFNASIRNISEKIMDYIHPVPNFNVQKRNFIV